LRRSLEDYAEPGTGGTVGTWIFNPVWTGLWLMRCYGFLRFHRRLLMLILPISRDRLYGDGMRRSLEEYTGGTSEDARASGGVW